MAYVAPERHQPANGHCTFQGSRGLQQPLDTTVLKTTGWITTTALHMLTGIADNKTERAREHEGDSEDRNKIVTRGKGPTAPGG